MGEYNHTIDAKSRVIIPSKFRNQLGETFILTRWMEKSLFGFPLDEWDKFEEKLATLPLGGKEARAFRRFVLAGAVEAEFDKQGRIIIPNNLKELLYDHNLQPLEINQTFCDIIKLFGSN
jgi:MraZ protein